MAPNPYQLAAQQQWINGQSNQPITVNTGTVYYGATTTNGAWGDVPSVKREPTPMEWLREQVDEMCELARAAA